MKRLLPFKLAFALAVLIALVFAMPASSAGLITGGGGWQWSNPSVQGNTINSVSFPTENTGYAAGIGGTVIKTTDGGFNWEAKIPSTSCGGVATAGCNLNGIHFNNASLGWVVGDYGTIWKTDNGGDTWTSQNSNLPASGCPGATACTSVFLKDIHFSGNTNGLAVGDGYAFGTVDGGATWTKVNSISTSVYMASVNMLAPSSGVIVGSDGVIYKVTETGGVWTATQPTSGVTDALRSVYFNDSLNGFAVGNNKLLRTTDGGTTWQTGTLAGGTVPLWGVTVSGNNLLVSGGTAGAGNGAIYKRTSTNVWTESISTLAANLTATSTGTTNQILAVVMPTATTGYAAGEAGVVSKSTNTGASWSLTAGGKAKGVSGASFINDTTGWMVAMDGSVMKTVDSGASWSDDSTGIPASSSLQAVQFLDVSNGFAVGFSGSNGVAYKYTSGTWTAMTLPAGVGSLWGIHMTSATTGWAVGIPGTGASSGVALKTTDGSTWAYDATGLGTDIQLYGVDCTDPATNGWAVGQVTGGDGILAKYSGGSWTYVSKTDTSFFSSVDMVDGNTGYAVGYDGGPPASGRGYKTIDGGANWNSTPVGTSKLLSEVSFVDANNGYASGDEGRVIKTTNGGTSWTLEGVGSSVGMNTVVAVPSVSSPSGIAAFIGGFNGAILRFGGPRPTKAITGFTIPGQTGATIIDEGAHTITLEMPHGTNVTALVPTITHTGASVNPGSGAAHDFTSPSTYTVTAEDASTQDYAVTVTVALQTDYWWTWYDNLSPGAQNWVLMANPVSAAQDVTYSLSIGGVPQSLAGWNNGLAHPGDSLTPQYAGLRNGPVDASIAGGYKGITSQRVLWAGNSLEEVVGTDEVNLSNLFYWPWYDDLTPGYTNYVMVANPGSTTVWYEIRIAGVLVTGAGSSGSIAPGQSAFWRDGTRMGGPVEVEAWNESGHLTPANVMASQRILSNGDTAFNELPGTPAGDRSDHYLWTWYDNIGAGGNNLILIGNPADGPDNLYYKIKVGIRDPSACSAAVPKNTITSWSEADLRDGPVELWAFSDPTCATPAPQAVATQRIVWGPSLEEVPGYPATALASTYHWTWYDELSPGSQNWVLVTNPNDTDAYYELKVAGVVQAFGTIAAHGNVTPHFTGLRDGPVEVIANKSIMASQRVLWNGYFNETLGTDLS